MRKCFPIIPICFQKFKIRLKQQIHWKRTLKKLETGLNNGKWLLIQTQQNMLKKSFFKKTRESFHSTFYFSKFVVTKVQSHKHLWHKLDKKLGIKDRHKDKFAKVNRWIGILKKLNGFLLRHSFVLFTNSLYDLT